MTRLNQPVSLAYRFAVMFGELTAQYLTECRADDAYIVACRAFHNASVYLDLERVS